jgi:hypothetical protein
MQKTSVFSGRNVGKVAKNSKKTSVFEGFWVLLGVPEGVAGSQLMTFFAHKEIFGRDTTCG